MNRRVDCQTPSVVQYRGHLLSSPAGGGEYKTRCARGGCIRGGCSVDRFGYFRGYCVRLGAWKPPRCACAPMFCLCRALCRVPSLAGFVWFCGHGPMSCQQRNGLKKNELDVQHHPSESVSLAATVRSEQILRDKMHEIGCTTAPKYNMSAHGDSAPSSPSRDQQPAPGTPQGCGRITAPACPDLRLPPG